MNSNDAAEIFYVLDVFLDGTSLSPNGWVASFTANQDGTGNGELFTLSYTITTAVTAGSYTVSQSVGPWNGTADFFHNTENLTVQFVPGGSVVSASSPAGAGDAGGSPQG